MALYHAFSSSKADAGDASLVRASNWNSDHVANSGGFNLQVMPNTSTLAATAAGSGTFYAREKAGYGIAAFQNSKSHYSLQTHIGLNGIVWWKPTAGVVTVPSGNFGIMPATTGTATSRNVTGSSFWCMTQRKLSLLTGATSGALCGWRGQSGLFWRPSIDGRGGFLYIHRFHMEQIPASGSRWFAGFNSSTANPVNVDPSANFNIVGFGCDAADTNIFFMHNDGAGAATKINTGIARPPVTQSSLGNMQVFEMRMFCPSVSGSGISASIEVLNPGSSSYFETSTSSSTDIPVADVALNPCGYLATAAATATGLAIVSLYIESDD